MVSKWYLNVTSEHLVYQVLQFNLHIIKKKIH